MPLCLSLPKDRLAYVGEEQDPENPGTKHPLTSGRSGLWPRKEVENGGREEGSKTPSRYLSLIKDRDLKERKYLLVQLRAGAASQVPTLTVGSRGTGEPWSPTCL